MNDAPVHSRASVLTPSGRGAVAVIGAEGPAAMAAADAHFRAANGKLLADQPIGRVSFGHWHDHPAANAPGEEVIVCRNGPWSFEIHCHGGVAAPRRILDALARTGCEIQSWQTWLQHDGARGLEAEAEIALAAAVTRRTAAILLGQRGGALRDALEAIRRDLTAGWLDEAQRRLRILLDQAPVGLHLTEPWQVALAGRPNVGKSSLINALVGYQRAIVFDQPGTTRDVLAAETAFDGWPVRLTDAAGLREPADELEAEGVAQARGRLGRADLVVWVLDATALDVADRAAPRAAAMRELAAEAPSLAAAIEPLVVVNKIDRAAPFDPQPSDVVFTCAVTGAGVDRLIAAIARRLVPHPPPESAPTPFLPRHFNLLAAAADALARDAAAAAAAILDCLLHNIEPQDEHSA
jgi:tRNA modification GTPase